MLFQSSFLLLLRLAVKLRLAPPDCLIMASHRRGRLLFAGLLFLLHGYARRLWGGVWKVEVLAMEAASDKDQFDEEFNEHLRVWTGPSLSSEAWPASWDPAEYGDGQASSGNQSADPAPPDPEDLPTTVLASVQGHLGPAAEADVPVPLEDEILYYDDYVERYLMLQEQPEEEDPTTDRPCSSGWGAVSGEDVGSEEWIDGTIVMVPFVPLRTVNNNVNNNVSGMQPTPGHALGMMHPRALQEWLLPRTMEDLFDMTRMHMVKTLLHLQMLSLLKPL
eukprot:s2865_g4.t1